MSTEIQNLLQEYRQSDSFARQFADRLPSAEYTKIVRYGAPVGCVVEYHERLGRCMDRLKELIGQEAGRDRRPLANGTVVIARELAAGSGRFDRQWFAPPGGLWLALAVADTLLPESARLLPLAAGSACCQAVRSFGVRSALKWVNDLHVDGRKIGGILCETYAGGQAADRYHLIGIGINCNNHHFPDELRESACSMAGMLGQAVDLEQFAVVLLAALSWHLGLVYLHEEMVLENRHSGAETDCNPVIDAWRRLSDTAGRRVIYGYDVVRRPLYRATVLDIDRDGGLMLRTEDGKQITETSGEIIYLDEAKE